MDRTRSAVQERLTKEINYWNHRANELKEHELAGKVNASLNRHVKFLRRIGSKANQINFVRHIQLESTAP